MALLDTEFVPKRDDILSKIAHLVGTSRAFRLTMTPGFDPQHLEMPR